MLRALLKLAKWGGLGLFLLIVLLLAPVGYVETFCRDDPTDPPYASIIKSAEFQRKEANSYLTYPEWHIVYAYEGLANILKSDDEHAFQYVKSIRGFWTSFCALNQNANRHGGGDFNTRGTIYTIGVSFTFEMIMKALYEETLGRLFALVRGSTKTPQDVYSAQMAADYAGFLQQVPWYKYDFDKATSELWEQPLTASVRGWERRLALGGEWKAKSGYAKVIAQAVAAAGQAQLRIRTVVKGLLPADLAKLEGVDVVSATPEHVLIETPRYRKFTEILKKIIAAGGAVVEIAGNDDIMLSALESETSDKGRLKAGLIISRIPRDGYDYYASRILVNLRLSDLGKVLKELEAGKRTLEHIYDY